VRYDAYLINAGGVGSAICLALVNSYDACTRSWKAPGRRFGKGQIKMVGKVDGPISWPAALKSKVGKTIS
jgi:hypothetical protein